MEQWRSLVSQLVAVCYRVSSVVSPVVQSSSPEGLIPMDSESGDARQNSFHLFHMNVLLLVIDFVLINKTCKNPARHLQIISQVSFHRFVL